MELAAIDQEQAATVVSVLGAVATARGTEAPSDADRAVINAAARHFLGGTTVPEELAASIPGEVAERLDTPESRRLTLAIASVLTFADVTVSDEARDGLLDPVRVTIVDDLARYLRVSALELLELRRVTKLHRERVAYDLFRRLPVSTSGDDMTMVETALVQSETRLDIDARRVHALWARIEGLPDGTVGSELIRYYRENGWTYPGTDHHQPLTVAEHDFHHVLGSYATTATGELQVGAFTAGVAEQPMYSAHFFLMWEQLGVGNPSIPSVSAVFEPEQFFAALDRGSRTSRDFIGDRWDPWSIVERDLDEMRAEYDIGPGAQLAAGAPYDRDPVTATH